MNHCVPDFETDDDYLFPASTNSKRHKKSAMGDEDIMELLWQNGQVVMQSQNQRSGGGGGGGGNKRPETTPSTAGREIRSGGIEDVETNNLFMQEDEMVSWLHYPSDENALDLYLNHNNDILYPVLPPSSAPATAVTSSLPPPLVAAPPPPPRPPPVPPLRRVEEMEEEEEPSQRKFANFSHFSRPNCNKLGLTGSGASNTNQQSQAVAQSTVVESNIGCRGSMGSFGAGTSSAGTGREPETCDLSASSSPGTGGSGASASAEPKPAAAADDRKRKGRDTDDTECYSEELEFEYHDPKKKSRGSSSSTKRSRAAEVHNLSERRRRDRINEKMKALQELIPRCNKSDKASMLDEAIEYLKSLQMQVQMMSMGYSMVPMMFPGVQRYMPAMAAMGMGMGIDPVGMNRGMVPYPSVLPSPPLPNSAAHLGQRFQVPRFQMAQVANPSDPMMTSFPPQNPNQPRGPFADPYQQCVVLPQTQLPQQQQQNQTGMPVVTSKPSSSKDVRYPQRHPTG